MSGQVGAFALQPSSLPQPPCTQEVDSRGDTALPSGWASLYRSPQHNAGNPADLPSSGGRAGVHLASCLAEWLEWVLGPFLIPSSPACPGRGWRRREKGRAASSQLQAGGWCALPCAVLPTFQGQDVSPAMELLASTLLESSTLLPAQTWPKVGGAGFTSRELMMEKKSFKIPAPWNWKHP